MKKVELNKISLKEQVREVLFEQIISGELKPGERLKIIPIAESLKVSQAPVREAIQCLVTSGYLELIPNAGARVKEFSDDEVMEIYELRKLLELGSLNCKKFDHVKTHAAMVRHFKKMNQAVSNNDFKEYSIHDTAFHRSIVEYSGNKKMLDIWDSLLVPKHITTIIRLSNATLKEGILLHTPIFEALENNDIAQAVQALKKHYDYLNI